MKHLMKIACLITVLCGSFAAAQESRKPAPIKRRPAVASPSVISESMRPEDSSGVRIAQYTEREVIPVQTKLRYTTLIILPAGEEILDITCGDKDFWVINGNQNLAYIKPAKAGAQTNLNLVTASGNVYSFTLSEVSETPNAQADIKVFVESKSPSLVNGANGSARFVSAQRLEECRQQLDVLKEELRRAKEEAQAAIDRGISRFISNVRFPYRFEAGKKPFFVRAMYRDDKFTYIQARPEETPTLYEVKDRKPSLINFAYKDGVYVADKILDQGYLAIGKQKLGFAREE